MEAVEREKPYKQFDNEELDFFRNEVIAEIFVEKNFKWYVNGTSVDAKKIKAEQTDFRNRKVKFAFTLADFIPKVRHQSLYQPKK